MSHPAIGAMIDTIPMALAGERPEDYLKVFGERLVHVHFIDGAPRGHLAWGDGVLDMKGYLQECSRYSYKGLPVPGDNRRQIQSGPYSLCFTKH